MDCTKGSPFVCFDILQHNGCQKIPKGPPFYIFWHCDTVKKISLKKIGKLFPQKAPLQFFFIFCNQLEFHKARRVPLLQLSPLDIAPTLAVLGMLLYINDLPRRVNASITYFAGDTNLFYNENTSLQSLADILDKVDDWMRSNKLKCSLNKSTAACFGKNTVNQQMEGLELNIRQKLKFLGVIIDEKLSFKDHISKVKTKLLFCNYTVWRRRRLLTNDQLLIYYKLHVKPIIQYGVLLYGCTSFSALQLIMILQRRLIRSIFRLPMFASVKDLMIEYEISSIYELHIYEFFKFIIDCLLLIKQIPERGYNFRHANQKAIVAVSRNKSFERCLSKRIPALFNLLLSWSVLPDLEYMSKLDAEKRNALCHDFNNCYIKGNEQLTRFAYGLDPL